MPEDFEELIRVMRDQTEAISDLIQIMNRKLENDQSEEAFEERMAREADTRADEREWRNDLRRLREIAEAFNDAGDTGG